VSRRLAVVLVAAATVLLLCGGYWFASWRSSPRRAPIPLSESIRRGDLEAVRRYLSSGGSPDAEVLVETSGWRITLLKEAIFDRETAIALALLDGGANFKASGARLIDVGANGMTELVNRLLPEASDDNPALTGIGTAAGHGYFDTVQSFIRFTEGRRTDKWLRAFGDAAGSAMLGGYDDVARALIDAGGRTPDMLHGAARFSSPGMVRYLLANGLDPTEVHDSGIAVIKERTPLDFAWKSYKDRVELARDVGSSDTEYLRGHDAEYVMFELLRAGAQTNDPELRAAARDGLAEIRAEPADAQLELAARIGFIDVVADLLKREVRWTNQAMREAVVAALQTDHDDIARMLLENGAPVDGGVLHAAANASSPGLVRYLLRKGANPAERLDGKTPVESWLENNSAQDPGYVLHELIVGGADVCWLRRRRLEGFSAVILKDSAPQCWDGDRN
jgi:ankyrin repeat protein